MFAEESARALVIAELSVDVCELESQRRGGPNSAVQLRARGHTWLCVDLAPSLDLGTWAFLGTRVSRC